VLQVALYFDKFTGVCQTMLHECKLNFLRIISDHDLFVEMPGRDPSERYKTHVFENQLYSCWRTIYRGCSLVDHSGLEIEIIVCPNYCQSNVYPTNLNCKQCRNYLASVLMQELFISLDHENSGLKNKVCISLCACFYL
jgi:hypothetical protein